MKEEQERTRSMTITVAYDTQGTIQAAAEIGMSAHNDRPVENTGLTVAELEIPEEYRGKALHAFVPQLKVDPSLNILVAK